MSEQKPKKEVFVHAKYRVVIFLLALWSLCTVWNMISSAMSTAGVITVGVIGIWSIVQIARENP